ncbi:MAG: hypothetical protein K0S32_708 [Bacteroidetes bacterium]|nr:hypothetical protein [Bacteroidota bacterium]
MVTEVNSSYGWIIKLKHEVNPGPAVSFLGPNQTGGPKPKLIVTVLVPFNTDMLRNWNQEETYDESGNVIAVEKIYLDALGRTTQKLGKNASNEVFRTQTVYDAYGRGAVKTMPAFTGNQLIYQTGFMRNQTAQPYSYTDFDTPGTLNNNNAIENNITNTLGYYYSNNNTYDTRQATATNPYTRIEYTGDPGGAERRVSKPGNAFKMGSGKESYSFTMPSGDELKYIYGSNFYYKSKRDSSDKNNSGPLTTGSDIVASKQIVITPDNKEQITYSIGGKMLASSLSGLSTDACNYAVLNTLYYKGTLSTDIHICDTYKSSLVFHKPTQATTPTTSTSYSDLSYTITDLYRDVVLVNGTDYSLNTSTGAISFLTPFSSLYTGRSYVLRISVSYDPTYEAGLIALSVTPADLKIGYSVDYGMFSKNYYDVGGALRKSVSPKGFACTTPTTITMATTYDYSHYGQLIAKKTPDEGLVEMTYDVQGKLRFTQNAVQKQGGRFSYVNYDVHGRAVETGEYYSVNGAGNAWFTNYYLLGPGSGTTGIHSHTILDSQDGLTTSGKSFTTVTGYFIPTGSGYDIPNSWTYYNNYQKFRNGQVNFIKNANSTIWFNYDSLGRQRSTITYVTDVDYANLMSSGGVDDKIKTSETHINFFNGLHNSSIYQENTSYEKMVYDYSYDNNLRPTVTTLACESGSAVNILTNSYDKLGRLNRVVTGNHYQGTDYVFTIGGLLKAINHPALDITSDPGADGAKDDGSEPGSPPIDLFGEVLDYHYNDYIRSGTTTTSSIASGSSIYNGLIHAVRFKTRANVNGTPTGMDYIDYGGGAQTQITSSTNYGEQELAFKFWYDDLNRLAKTNFYTYNNNTSTYSSRTEYAETGASSGNIAYDRNGNITRMVRQAFNSVVLDNLTYTVNSTGNQVGNILDAASNSYPAGFNFKTPSTSASSSFSYNAIGQLTVSSAEGIDSVCYFADGKVKRIIFTNGDYTLYDYGADGAKLKSTYYNSGGNYFKYNWFVGPFVYELNEGATGKPNVKEVKIPGGVIRIDELAEDGFTSPYYKVFYVTDHLGNVRATYKPGSATESDNSIEILSTADYYAWGGKLPGRIWEAEACRNAYQGQEKIEDGSNPWYQFELRQYNQDIGRWFAPDPYGQFESPYIAMANNPVSGVDPDGGWVNASRDLKGQQFRNKAEMERARQGGYGAYSNDAIQKRYTEEYENITKHFLSNDYDRRNDINGYLKAVQTLNASYSGLTKAFGSDVYLSYQSGIDELTSTEMILNSNALGTNNDQVQGLSGNSSFKESMLSTDVASMGNSLGSFAVGIRESSSRKAFHAAVSIMAKNDDGGSTILDPNGMVVDGLAMVVDIANAIAGTQKEMAEIKKNEALAIVAEPGQLDLSTARGDQFLTHFDMVSKYVAENNSGSFIWGNYFTNTPEGFVSFYNIETEINGGTKVKVDNITISGLNRNSVIDISPDGQQELTTGPININSGGRTLTFASATGILTYNDSATPFSTGNITMTSFQTFNSANSFNNRTYYSLKAIMGAVRSYTGPGFTGTLATPNFFR